MATSYKRLPAAALLFLALPSLQLLLVQADDTFQFYQSGKKGNLECPAKQPLWKTSLGVTGGIVDTNTQRLRPGMDASSPSELYHYHLGKPYGCSGILTPAKCSQLCKQWPRGLDDKTVMTPSNGVGGPCAYWSWDGFKDCYLFSCDACKDSGSFIPLMKKQGWWIPFQSGSSGVDCTHGGGVVGDPHFTGADGSHFDFSGHPGQVYCLVSDAHVHVNAYYGGRYGQWGENKNKSMTWIRKVAILWGHHSIVLEAREGANWQYDSGYLASLQVDGSEVTGLEREGDVARAFDGQLSLTWASAKLPSGDDLVDVYEVTIENVVTAHLTLRPEVSHLRTSADGVVHFGVSFPSINLTNSAHGVLGQTYRADHRSRLEKQDLVLDEHLEVHAVPGENAEGFLDADEAAYRATGLMNADCSFSRFMRASVPDDESSRAIELSKASGLEAFYYVSRKMLQE